MKNLITNCLIRLVLLSPILSLAQYSDCATASINPIVFVDPTQNSCNQWKSDPINISTASVAASFPNGICSGGGTPTHNYWVSFIMPPNSSTSFSIQYNILGSCTPDNMKGLATSVYTGTCGALTNMTRQCNFCNSTTCTRRTFTNALYTPGKQIFLQVFDVNEFNCDLEMIIFISPSHDNCTQPLPINSMMYCNRGGTKNDPINSPGSCSPKPPHNGGIFSIDNAIWFSFTVLPTDPQPYAITMEHISCISGTKAMQMLVYNTSCDCSVSLNPCLINCTAQSEPPTSDSLTIVPGASLTPNWFTPPGNYLLAIDGGNGADCTWGFDLDPLPLQFISVSAEIKDEETTLLWWLIADEHKAAHFEILKSSEGSIFQYVGSLTRNEHISPGSYVYTDEGASGYYKIAMTDLNGKRKYSQVFSAGNAASEFSVVPTVVTENIFMIKTNAAYNLETEVVVTNQLGSILFLQKFQTQNILEQAEFSTLGWSPGMYFVQIKRRDQIKVLKIQIVN